MCLMLLLILGYFYGCLIMWFHFEEVVKTERTKRDNEMQLKEIASREILI